jgi:hypothetical protein
MEQKETVGVTLSISKRENGGLTPNKSDYFHFGNAKV